MHAKQCDVCYNWSLGEIGEFIDFANKFFWTLFIFFDSLSSNVTYKRSYQSQNLNGFDKGQVIFYCLRVLQNLRNFVLYELLYKIL